MSTTTYTFSPGRVLYWTAFNAFFAYCAYLGAALDVTWAGNITKFLLWFMVVIYTLAMLVPDKSKLRAKGPIVPMRVSIFFDLVIAVMLAAFGWFGYATLCIYQGMALAVIYSPDKDEATNE